MSGIRSVVTTPVSRLSIWQIEEISHGQRAKFKAQREQVEIVLGLLEMRKAGLLLRVHVHESRIAVELPPQPDVKRSVTWAWAAKIVMQFRLRQMAGKGPKRQIATAKAAER